MKIEVNVANLKALESLFYDISEVAEESINKIRYFSKSISLNSLLIARVPQLKAIENKLIHIVKLSRACAIKLKHINEVKEKTSPVVAIDTVMLDVFKNVFDEIVGIVKESITSLNYIEHLSDIEER